MHLEETLRGHVLIEAEAHGTSKGGDETLEEDEWLAIKDLIDHGVQRAEAAVLVLSEHVLHSPPALLQIFEVLLLEKPLVCVYVDGCGYDFLSAHETLRRFRERLAAVAPNAYRQVRERVHERGFGFGRLQEELLEAIPNKIAITFNPLAHVLQKRAIIGDIARRIQSNATAEPPKRLSLRPTTDGKDAAALV